MVESSKKLSELPHILSDTSKNISEQPPSQILPDPSKNNKSQQNTQSLSPLEIRDDVHAGVWYTNRSKFSQKWIANKKIIIKIENELETQINCWMELAKFEMKNYRTIKALIVPLKSFNEFMFLIFKKSFRIRL